MLLLSVCHSFGTGLKTMKTAAIKPSKINCGQVNHQGSLRQTNQVNLQSGSLEKTDGLTATYVVNKSDSYTGNSLHLKQRAITIHWFDHHGVWMWGQLPLEN